MHSVIGFHIQAVDAVIGRLGGFLVDGDNWVVSDLLAEAGHWYSGKEVKIPPAKVERISFEESTVFVGLTKADIERTAEHQVAHGASEGPRG